MKEQVLQVTKGDF
ncbi:TPA: DUF3948 family protein, partial [Bacillus cereus]|nr:DUF3948 family protein [Bacillus thuringiensis]HDR4539855.1 DUF3948 family protein [Bacillus cereus]